MTFPTINARTSSETTTDGGTHSVALGAPVAGELLVVISSFDAVPSIIAVDTAISGHRWHAGPLVTPAISTVTSIVHWKVADGSDALTLLIDASEQCSHFAIRISGHASAVAMASSTGNSTNADPPNVAITGAAQDVLFIAASCQDSALVATVAPAGYANLTTKLATNPSGASVSIADKTANATSDNPGAFTTAAEQWVAWAIAIPSVTIPTNTRPTQLAVEASSHIESAMRSTQFVIESSSSLTAALHATQLCVEVVSENVPDDTLTAQPVMLFIAT
jgi:hypothetical protein